MDYHDSLHRHLLDAKHREWTARAAEERLARQIAGAGLLTRWWRRVTSSGRAQRTAGRVTGRRPGVSVTR